MRVAFLAPGSSIHTVRWVNGLVRRGLEVHLITAHSPLAGIDPAVHTHRLGLPAPAAYLLGAQQLRGLLREIQPDLLNAHYASGYGSLARLSRFRPLLLSVWGSDIYDFPRISPLHRWWLRGNLRAANAIASTSRCMARRTVQLHPNARVITTPFGVDPERFVPRSEQSTDSRLVIGTVKTLSPKYGLDVLLDAFALAVEQAGSTYQLRLEITGGGPDEDALRRGADRLGIQHLVSFHGPVPHDQVPSMLHRLDVFAALSRDDSETFGVSVVEAAACAIPVVVSDVEGLAEVTLHGQTGFVVPREDPVAAAEALLRLAGDRELRRVMGAAGRRHVLDSYTWDRSLDLMVDAYHAVTSA